MTARAGGTVGMTALAQEPVIRPISGGSLPLPDDLQRQVDVPGLFAPGNPGYWRGGGHARDVRFLIDPFRSLAP